MGNFNWLGIGRKQVSKIIRMFQFKHVSTLSIAAGSFIHFCILSNGSLVIFGYNDYMGNLELETMLIQRKVWIGLGRISTLLLSNGSLFTFGLKKYGIGKNVSSNFKHPDWIWRNFTSSIAAGAIHSLCIKWISFEFGDNSSGELGIGTWNCHLIARIDIIRCWWI
jgi:alpha-tubulin suppressor-like RCC1 family protein